jgi:hypothetical protein
LAFDTWAGDNNGQFPLELSRTKGGTLEFIAGPNEWRHFQVMSNALGTSKVLICPADTTRAPAASFSSLANSNLSYFIDLDFARPDPQAIWSGDRNITNGTPVTNGVLELTSQQPAGWTAELHNKCGNVALGDGSISQVSAAGLRNAVNNTHIFTNRLQMPVLGP